VVLALGFMIIYMSLQEDLEYCFLYIYIYKFVEKCQLCVLRGSADAVVQYNFSESNARGV